MEGAFGGVCDENYFVPRWFNVIGFSLCRYFINVRGEGGVAGLLFWVVHMVGIWLVSQIYVGVGGSKWCYSFMFSVSTSKFKIKVSVHRWDSVGQWSLMFNWVIWMGVKDIASAFYISVWWLYHRVSFLLRSIYGLDCSLFYMVPKRSSWFFLLIRILDYIVPVSEPWQYPLLEMLRVL